MHKLYVTNTKRLNVGFPERLASVVGGPLLAVYGLSRGTPAGFALAATGGVLLYRGLTGFCPAYGAAGVSTAAGQNKPIHVEKSVTVERPTDELYAFWRDFNNLPRFMKHLKDVRAEEDCSHWVATGPAGIDVEWDAEITVDQPGEMISWRSLPGAEVDNSGSVTFAPAPGNRGTVVSVIFDYAPPAGKLGATVAALFGEEPGQQVEGDLRRFKNVMEAGEIPTIAGQPSGTRSRIGQALQADPPPTLANDGAKKDEAEQPKKPYQPKKPPVTEASEESFPASDPPAWTGTEAENDKKVGAK